MMKTKLAVWAFIATLLLVASSAGAQPPGGRQQYSPDEFLERDLEKLGLDAGQTKRVHAILAAARERRVARRPEMRTAFDRMRELLEADLPDEAAVMKQVERIGALKMEEHKDMVRTLLAVRAELTPEQRRQLKAMSPDKGPPPWRRDRRGGGAEG